MRRGLLSGLVLLGIALCRAAHAQVSEGDKRACIDAASLGQSERDAGHLLEARAQFLSCAREACPAIIRNSCTEWVSELRLRIPSVVVRVLSDDGHDVVDVQASVDGASISLDGRPVTLDPGQHTLRVSARDAAPIEQVILAVEQQAPHVVTVRLARTDAPAVAPPATQVAPEPGFRPPTGAWMLAGVGVVAAASFTYFGLSAQHDLDHLENSCAPHCQPAATQSGRVKAVVADVSLGIAVAALVSATLWTLLPARADQSPTATAGLVPVQGGAMGVLSTNL